MKRVYGYVRVSTNEQATTGHSLAVQRTKLEAYATATDRTLYDVIVDDGYSAKSLARPGLQKILDEVRKGKVAAIIVVKLDRLTRSVRDLDTLLTLCRQKDVDLVSIGESLDTSSAAGRMVLNIMTSVAQWEREAISERTVAVLSQRRTERRVYSAHVPMGYRRSGDELVVDPHMMDVVTNMQQMRTNGHSLLSIAQWLNETNVPTQQGGTKWRPNSVRAVLCSRMNQEAS
jgi:DNA invertase Pin-like site-specific DNA recombinase